MIVSELGRPLPPEGVVKSLHQVDDRLGLKYVAYHHRDGINMNTDERWAIILNWGAEDDRRVMIQRGQMAPDAAFDILAYLPIDASPEDAFSIFANGAKQFHRKSDVERLVSRIDKFNAKTTEAAKEETTQLAEELISTNAPTLFAAEGKTTPKVYVSKK